MEKNLKLRQVSVGTVLTEKGTNTSISLYISSNFDSKEEIVEFLEEFLKELKSEDSTTQIIHAHAC